MNKKQIIGVTGCLLLIVSCFAQLWVFIINLAPPNKIYTSKIYDIIQNGFVVRGEVVLSVLLLATIVLICIKRYYYLILSFSLISLAIIIYDLKDMFGYFRDPNISSTVWSWGWYTLGPGIILLIIYLFMETRKSLLKA